MVKRLVFIGFLLCTSLLGAYETKVLITTEDNIAVTLNQALLPYLKWDESKTNVSSDSLPKTVQLKNVKEVFTEINHELNNLYHLQGTSYLDAYKPFGSHLSEYEHLGTNYKGQNRLDKYKYQKDFNIDLSSDSILIIQNDSKEIWIKTPVHCLMHKRDFNIREDGFYRDGQKIICIWENPPIQSIYQVYPRISKLNKKSKLLVVYMDGLGWTLLNQYLQANPSEFISKLPIQPMRAPYIPKTKNSYYILGTGVLDREKKRETFSDISPLKSLIMEGSEYYYSTKLPLNFSKDLNDDKLQDEEIMNDFKLKYKDKNFILIHFDNIDNTAHKFGPYASETYDQIYANFSYLKQIMSIWKGKIILLSDHGMHSSERGGTHYLPIEEDIIAIYGEIK